MYTEVPTTDGLYLVDYDLINRILHDSYYLQGKNSGARLITEKEGWGLPETYHYEVDYASARVYAESMRLAFNAMGKVGAYFHGRSRRTSQLPTGADMEDLKGSLFDIERAGHGAAETLKKKQKDATKRSMKNIHDKVDTWETATEVAKFTRNASADIILVTGAVMSGGTATVALGAGGSLMKGAFKYQDTGNVAAGVMESTVSFVTFVIPAPDAGMTKSMARTLIFTKAKWELAGNTAVGLVEGKSLGEASLSAAVDVALGGMADKVKGTLIPEAQMKRLMKDGLNNIAIPVGLGLMDRSIATTQKKLGDAATKKIMALAKVKKNVGKPGLRNVAMSSPVLVDLAVAGPDRSTPTRRW